MKKIISILYILLLLSVSIVFSENSNTDQWKFEKQILINEELEYKTIMLDKEVYKYSKAGLSLDYV